MLESFGILTMLCGAAGLLFLIITGVGSFVRWLNWVRRTR